MKLKRKTPFFLFFFLTNRLVLLVVTGLVNVADDCWRFDKEDGWVRLTRLLASKWFAENSFDLRFVVAAVVVVVVVVVESVDGFYERKMFSFFSCYLKKELI